MKKLYKDGVLTKCSEIWAEGLDSWCKLESVAQFRWTVCLKRQETRKESDIEDDGNEIMEIALYNPTELTTLVLEIFIQMCSFFPSR